MRNDDRTRGIKILVDFLIQLYYFILIGMVKIYVREDHHMPDTDLVGNYEPRTEQELTRVVSALRGVRYGSVEITIHDSRIVQIERREKLRFERER